MTRAKRPVSVLLLAFAIVSTIYFSYPSIPQIVPEIHTGSTTSISVYIVNGLQVTSTTITTSNEFCDTCHARTSTTTSYISTTETMSVTSFNQGTVHLTSYRTVIAPPYATLGLDLTRFVLLMIVQFNVIGMVILLLQPRHPGD